VEKAPKPLPACATPVTDGMKVQTHSEKPSMRRRRDGVPADQSPARLPDLRPGRRMPAAGHRRRLRRLGSRYHEPKRVVKDKELGPLIATDMTRCIHCSRCIRFGQEIAGLMELGMPGARRACRSHAVPGNPGQPELSGNVIELCPVGALTSKPFRYKARSWELSRRKSVSPHDGLGANLQVHVKGNQVLRVVPLDNEAINECWIADRDRFSYDALNAISA
jgi:NADH-quinone oxidoreductase subunit G